jgi:ribosomal protein S18 acetylase RimI-like enzyme
MGETVVVHEAASADVDAAVALWTASHVARRNGRPLPEAHIALARQRMAIPGAMLLLARSSSDGDQTDGNHTESDHSEGGHTETDRTEGDQTDSDQTESGDGGVRGDDGTAALIGTILGVQGLAQDGAGPPVPGLLHMSLLSVAPDRWGQHVGRLLVEAVLTRATTDGFREAQLWTHADNLRANRLYKAMAFRRSGRVRVDDWGELLVHYRRRLAD